MQYFPAVHDFNKANYIISCREQRMILGISYVFYTVTHLIRTTPRLHFGTAHRDCDRLQCTTT